MENNTKKESNFQNKESEKVIDGVKYHKVDSGYTLRQYYSHNTPEKGPGPGWDNRWEALQKYGVNEPQELPDDIYYIWEQVEE